MGTEVRVNFLNFTDAKTGARFILESDAGLEIERDVKDIGTDGIFVHNMAGYGQPIGTRLFLHVDDFNGANHDTIESGYGSAIVADDGAPAATVLRVTATGDSFIDTASSTTYEGVRLPNKQCTIIQKGFHASAVYMMAAGDYLYRDDTGKAGDTTGGILSRIGVVTASDADLVIICMGTNDAAGDDIEASKQNYTDTIAALTAAGKLVLIQPQTQRNDIPDPTTLNIFIDALNAHCVTLAANNDGVEIAAVATAFNAAMMSNQVDFGFVSDDGLHPNDKGGLLIASESTAPALNLHFPSTIEDKSSIIDEEFSGTDGGLLNFATGSMPTGIYGYYANPTTDVGFQTINDGGGKPWLHIRTDGSATPQTSSANKFKATYYPYVTQTAGRYVAEIKFVCDNPEVLAHYKLSLDSEGSTYSYVSIEKTIAANNALTAGQEYTLRTPDCWLENDAVIISFLGEQVAGVDCQMRITDWKVYPTVDVI